MSSTPTQGIVPDRALGLPPPPPPPPPPASTSHASQVRLRVKTTDFKDFFQTNCPSAKPAPLGAYFCYGTLMDPSMLRDILSLPEGDEPILRAGYIVGYERRLWGQYPALLDADQGPGSVIHGAVYLVQSIEHGQRLAEYETSIYRADPCHIFYSDGKEPTEEDGYTFKFVGDRDQLSDGGFDLQIWLKRIGRHANAVSGPTTS